MASATMSTVTIVSPLMSTESLQSVTKVDPDLMIGIARACDVAKPTNELLVDNPLDIVRAFGCLQARHNRSDLGSVLVDVMPGATQEVVGGVRIQGAVEDVPCDCAENVSVSRLENSDPWLKRAALVKSEEPQGRRLAAQCIAVSPRRRPWFDSRLGHQTFFRTLAWRQVLETRRGLLRFD